MKSVEFPHLHLTSRKVLRHLAKRHLRNNCNTAPQTILIAYQEFIHARLTLLKVDPFDRHLLLLRSAESGLDHGSGSAPWGETESYQHLTHSSREGGRPDNKILSTAKTAEPGENPVKALQALPTVQLPALARPPHPSAGQTEGEQVDLYGPFQGSLQLCRPKTLPRLQLPYKRVILLMYF